MAVSCVIDDWLFIPVQEHALSVFGRLHQFKGTCEKRVPFFHVGFL